MNQSDKTALWYGVVFTGGIFQTRKSATEFSVGFYYVPTYGHAEVIFRTSGAALLLMINGNDGHWHFDNFLFLVANI
uniref:Uncharacterized protein n=1 Tax=Prevotella sp. GTC17253 TaxID=3236793 RepID=A0AB33IWQ7_9BACT